MSGNSDMPLDFASLLELANSPAGKKLLQLVKEQSGGNLTSAMKKAEAGDLSSAKEIIGGILATPEAEKLIQDIEVPHERT